MLPPAVSPALDEPIVLIHEDLPLEFLRHARRTPASPAPRPRRRRALLKPCAVLVHPDIPREVRVDDRAIRRMLTSSHSTTNYAGCMLPWIRSRAAPAHLSRRRPARSAPKSSSTARDVHSAARTVHHACSITPTYPLRVHRPLEDRGIVGPPRQSTPHLRRALLLLMAATMYLLCGRRSTGGG
jgi:hypothetical protein